MRQQNVYLSQQAYLKLHLSSWSQCHSEVERKRNYFQTNYNCTYSASKQTNKQKRPAFFLFFSASLVTVREKAEKIAQL